MPTQLTPSRPSPGWLQVTAFLRMLCPVSWAPESLPHLLPATRAAGQGRPLWTSRTPHGSSRAGVWAPPSCMWCCAETEKPSPGLEASTTPGTRSQPRQTAPSPQEPPGPSVLLGLPYEAATAVGKAGGQAPTVPPKELLTGPRRLAGTLKGTSAVPWLGSEKAQGQDDTKGQVARATWSKGDQKCGGAWSRLPGFPHTVPKTLAMPALVTCN